jgi:hypothetical protein
MVPHDTMSSQSPLVLVGDSLVCEETEDLHFFDEDPGHPQVIPEAILILLGEFSGQSSARPVFAPFVPIHGLMSRRF